MKRTTAGKPPGTYFDVDRFLTLIASGATYASVGRTLGISKQAAQQRIRTLLASTAYQVRARGALNQGARSRSGRRRDITNELLRRAKDPAAYSRLRSSERQWIQNYADPATRRTVVAQRRRERIRIKYAGLLASWSAGRTLREIADGKGWSVKKVAEYIGRLRRYLGEQEVAKRPAFGSYNKGPRPKRAIRRV